MQGTVRNRAHRLRRRPEGSPSDVDNELVEETVPDLEPGQALVRTIHVSTDPTTRVRMSDYPASMPAAPLDAVVRDVGVAVVNGIEKAPEALRQLFTGSDLGKIVRTS